MAHRSAEPRVGARLRRPALFDEAAEHDAVNALQARFEQAEYPQPCARDAGAPHHALRNGGEEQLGIIRSGEREVVGCTARQNVVERRRESLSLLAGKRRDHARGVGRERRHRVAMARRDFAERHGARTEIFKRRQGGGKPRNQSRGRFEVVIGEMLARVVRVQRAALAAQRRQCVREAGRTGARTRAAQDRPFERRGRAIVGALGGAEPKQRMLDERKQRHGRKPAEPRFRDEAGEASDRGLVEPIAAGIVGRNAPARERGDHPPGKPAIRRHQRRNAVRTLERLAQRDRDRERFLVGIRGLDHREAFERARNRRIVEPLAPMFGRGRGPHRFRNHALAAVRRGVAERRHGRAVEVKTRQQSLHGELRVPSRGRERVGLARSGAGDHLPGGLVEVGVEARQHHGAMRQPRDGGEQLGGRRHRAGRARRDDGRIAGREPRGFGRDQKIPAGCGLDRAALGEDRRPGVARDLEKRERELPIRIEPVWHQRVEPAPRHLTGRHVIDQPGEIVGEPQRRGGAVGDQRRAARAVQPGRTRPAQHQPGQQQPALERAKCRRQVERGLRGGTRGDVRKRELVLVDVADGANARQQR